MSEFGSKQVSAGLSEQGGTFIVEVGENGQRTKRKFRRREEAKAFLEAEEKRLGLRR